MPTTHPDALPSNGKRIFTLYLKDTATGESIQPSRNTNRADVFDPTGTGGANVASNFVTPFIRIWDDTLPVPALVNVPGAYNVPALAAPAYGGTPGVFTVEATGTDARATALLVGQKWALVWDTQVNGEPFETFEFFTIVTDGGAEYQEGAAAADTAPAYGDADMILRQARVAPDDVGLASKADLDAYVLALNQRASAAIDHFCGRDFILHSDQVEAYDGTDEATMALRGWPVVSIASVKNDGTLIAATEYRQARGSAGTASSGILESRVGIWPKAWNRYEVTYTYGYAAPPKTIQKVAEGIVVRALHATKAGMEAAGASSISMDGFSTTYDRLNLDANPSSFEQIVLTGYRVLRIG